MSSGMRIRLYEPGDYPRVEAWWRGHGWDPVPEAILPKLGVVALHEGTPVAAGWAYMDNSVGVSMLEWLVADPEAAPRQVLAALGHVITFLKAETKALGYAAMLGTCRQPALSRVLERHGFSVTDREVIHHLAIL